MPFSMGSTGVVTQPELNREKRPPLPAEEVAASGQVEVAFPGSRAEQTIDLRSTTSDLERISMAFNRRLRFEVDHESSEILIKVIDSETDKVIKELPPEELRRLHSSLRETIGFLFDRTV
jgi:flagellar protein FlaG